MRWIQLEYALHFFFHYDASDGIIISVFGTEQNVNHEI